MSLVVLVKMMNYTWDGREKDFLSKDIEKRQKMMMQHKNMQEDI
jgi:hypothetical protein